MEGLKLVRTGELLDGLLSHFFEYVTVLEIRDRKRISCMHGLWGACRPVNTLRVANPPVEAQVNGSTS